MPFHYFRQTSFYFVSQEYLKPVLQNGSKETVATARNILYPVKFTFSYKTL